jgi:hypothetical protein
MPSATGVNVLPFDFGGFFSSSLVADAGILDHLELFR